METTHVQNENKEANDAFFPYQYSEDIRKKGVRAYFDFSNVGNRLPITILHLLPNISVGHHPGFRVTQAPHVEMEE